MGPSTQKDQEGHLVFLFASFEARFSGVYVRFWNAFSGVLVRFWCLFSGVLVRFSPAPRRGNARGIKRNKGKTCSFLVLVCWVFVFGISVRRCALLEVYHALVYVRFRF